MKNFIVSFRVPAKSMEEALCECPKLEQLVGCNYEGDFPDDDLVVEGFRTHKKPVTKRKV